jgi:hypothetical protein
MACHPKLEDRLSFTLRAKDGGGERDRTDGLLVANQALSQLSYTPRGNVASPPTLRAPWLAKPKHEGYRFGQPAFALRAAARPPSPLG